MPRLSELQREWNHHPVTKTASCEESMVVDNRGRTGPAQMVDKKFFDLVRRRNSLIRRKAK